MSVLQEFLEADCDEHVRSLLLAELDADRPAYLTFNVFNVRIHPDLGVVTIEDELDRRREESVDITDFREAVQRQVL